MFTERYLRDLHTFNDKRLGVQFGKLCAKANLPPSMIAGVLGVSRMTIYNWFKGKALRNKNIDRLELAIDIIEDHLDQNNLPVNTHREAKEFIKNNLDGKV